MIDLQHVAGRRFRSGTSLVCLAIAGIVAVGLWRGPWLGRDNAVSNIDEAIPAASSPAALATPDIETDDSVNVDTNPRTEEPGSGSLQATLLETTEANRNQILSLTISDAGYECPAIGSAKAVGNNGSVWRVNCGEAFVYWIEVNEIGRLLVAPLPYGDSVVPGIPRREFPPEMRRELQEQTIRPLEPR